MNFLKKYYKLIIILVVIVGVLLGLRIYNKLREEKRNKEIINYCENIKWKMNDADSDLNFFNDDDLTCGYYLYLKPAVKKSDSGICHDENSTYYYRTKSYKTFNSMDDCLESGGRKPYN